MLHVMLFEPQIPPNTGNVMRLCANSGATLHLIGPLGFELDDTRLKRAGLDYRHWADVRQHDDLDQARLAAGIQRIYAFTTKGSRRHCDVRFAPGDGLLFGPETRGLPASLLEALGPDQCLRIPMQPESRSLNLANAVAIGLYEAMRQLEFGGLE
ncbi:MAG: tRNA (cytidine(34)-2'-O)-methyltransferase [Gammaproteobacteria bacterium]|nr:MAG: tRNA (cytidine(34)-2'-O)-methyltransferase [Gammaproteobacteria bacterium]